MQKNTPVIAPYGAWSSPITSDLIAAHPIRFGDLVLDGDDVYWTEARPWEQGRAVVVRLPRDGEPKDVTPAPFNARTLVHEYGGGALLAAGGTVYFTNLDPGRPHADQRIHRIAPDEADPQPVTGEASVRYADMVLDARRGRLIAVRETHTDRPGQANGEPVNDIISIDLTDPASIRVLASGNDFYAAPRLSPDGNRLAYISWSHPHMPWTETTLWCADLNEAGDTTTAERIAGGPGVSAVQPEWSPDGTLFFVTDETGWWTIARAGPRGPEILVEREAEFAQPLWQLGASSYGFLSPDVLVCSFGETGTWRLGLLRLAERTLTPIELPFATIRAVRVAAPYVYAFAAAPDMPETLVRIDPSNGTVDRIRASFDVDPDIVPYFSEPESLEFPTTGGATAHAFYYPPKNPGFNAPEDEKPPLIVMSHGGPTAATSAALSLARQFWTSRGFGVVDVNYRGSTGYGRAYRFALERQWGLADVDDCIAAARFLIDQGRVDPDRVGITGGSAGGYTTLSALTFHDFFKTGGSHYGIGDLEALAKHTHKFESRYLDWLIGPYPQDRDTYLARSPIHHVDRLNAAVAFFQGALDKVVPPEQADEMVAALRARNCPTLYLLFEDEQHGFRKGPNIKRALDAELAFFSMWLSGTQLRFSG